jgi:hypothetical protein
MPRIFISYRRADSGTIVGRIYDSLVARFGKAQIFMDVDNIPSGTDFRDVLQENLDKSDVVLALIGPQWANVTNSKGERRLDDEGDYVRLELEIALRSSIIVIPVLVLGAEMPVSSELPEGLKDLVFLQAAILRSDPDFQHSMQRLIRRLIEIDEIPKKLGVSFLAGFVTILLALVVFGLVLLFNQMNVTTATETAIAENVDNTETASPTTAVPTTVVPTTVVPTTAVPVVENPTEDISGTGTSVVLTNESVNLGNTSVAETNEAVLSKQTGQAAYSQTHAADIATQTSNAASRMTLTAESILTQTSTATNPAFPNGLLIEFSYNAGGFYLRNASDSNIRLSNLRFQAMDALGNSLDNALDGVDWTRFYSNVDRNGRCVIIELLDQAEWSRPNNCVGTGSSEFNSQLTFPTNDQRIFWDGRNGATQFSVSWNGTEAGRCAIQAGFCSILVGR